MQPFEIYRAQVQFRDCSDARPWLVVELRPNKVIGCFPISTKCYSSDCFEMLEESPDFAATGLARASFVICTTIFELKAEQFEIGGKLHYKGQLKGSLLQEFRKFAGV